MSDDVGALVARVVADTEQFRTEMTRVSRQLETNTARMNKALASVNKSIGSMSGVLSGAGKVAAAFGVALSIRALSNFTMQAIKAGAELNNLSERLNISVESLSELQYVAKLNDVEFASFTRSLQFMVRTIGEAEQGTKSAVKTFDNLGVSTQFLKSLAVDQQFEVMARALAGVTDETQRAALAQEVFGRSGVENLQIINQGTDAIKRQREEARTLGAVMTKDMAEAANRADDAMDRLNASLSSLANNAMPTLAKALELIATGWNRILFGADPFPFEAQIAAQEKLVSAMQVQLAASGGMSKAWITDFQSQIDVAVAKLAVLKTSQEAALGLGIGGASGGNATAQVPVLTQLVEANRLLDELAAGYREAQLAKLTAFGEDLAGAVPSQIDQRQIDANQLVKDTEADLTQFIRDQALERERAMIDSWNASRDAAFAGAQEEIFARQMVTNASIGFLQAIGSKHRGAAIAALAIQKALAVKEILIQSQVAQMRAIAELGPIAGPVAAAAIAVKGGISAALVAATGLIEASQLSSGGTQATLGTSANPISTRSSEASGVVATQRQRAVQIIFQGDVFGWDETMRRKVVSSLRTLIDEQDVVIFGPQSRQAQALLGA